MRACFSEPASSPPGFGVHCDRAAEDCKALCDEPPIIVIELRTGADERGRLVAPPGVHFSGRRNLGKKDIAN